jgi:hypothetical protein
MALKKTIEYKGFTLANAYIKVLAVNVNKEACSCLVGFFADAAQKEPLFTQPYNSNMDYPFTHDNDGGNALQQAYAYLKTLPTFSGAGDV